MGFDLLPHSFFELPDGGRLRYARFAPEGAAKGTLIVIPGRREFIEKKRIELAPALERGLRLIVVEPRGHGLSSRFLTDPELRHRDHASSFNAYLADLRAFFTSVVLADADGPLFLHGHSMGGHLALRWLAEDKPPVDAAFLTAPMLSLATSSVQAAAQGMSWLRNHLWADSDYAPMQHDYNDEDRRFDDNPLTADAARFAVIENYFTAHPDLAVGGVTWGWMSAALNSMHIAHARHYLSAIDLPVLALIGAEDGVTPLKENAPYLNYIPRVRVLAVPGARHDVLNEAEAPRTEAWARINAFLDEVTPA